MFYKLKEKLIELSFIINKIIFNLPLVALKQVQARKISKTTEFLSSKSC
jgi:hypothetical protein